MISKNLDSKMLVYYSDNQVEIINDCIVRNNVKHIVFANSGIKPIDFEELLYVKSGEIEIHSFRCK